MICLAINNEIIILLISRHSPPILWNSSVKGIFPDTSNTVITASIRITVIVPELGFNLLFIHVMSLHIFKEFLTAYYRFCKVTSWVIP